MKSIKEIPKAYDASSCEDDIYKSWEESGYFNPDNLDLSEDAESFTIMLPPPNITAKLHLGHASMVAIEDAMIRFARMNGKRALWIPGTDHSAIATQNVVEKKLLKEEGKTRHDLGREAFLKRVWDFLYETQSIIQTQIRKTGGSLDWSRECFTLDEKRVKVVKEIFCRMYEEDIIYRGHRIVNWCPRCSSTLADDEVEYKEQDAKLYYIKYGPFIVATTRPETKIGDTAVAVHPDDERYKKYLGQEMEINLGKVDIKVKVIADEHIDMNFGSGVVGVTPAHSFVDFEMAQKHGAEVIQVIGPNGKMTDKAGPYKGLGVLECRELFLKDLENAGLLEKSEDLKNNLSICYRCDTAIEPLVSKQWFIGVDRKIPRLGNKSLKEKALEVVDSSTPKEKQIEFVPNRFEKRYKAWMENLHDWCISRQIWFGHRIPVWYCQDCEEMICSREDNPKKCTKCDSTNLVQDEDSLDTWFSSGTWTFSTLGWPEETKDLKTYHPTSVLETGYEILTLWVSRMIMMSFYAVEEKPFDTVYLHGMILDKEGKKMSKSKGNGIDPLDMVEKYGTDALRISIIYGNTPGNDMRLSEEKIESMKKFVNKLWNISRYILTSIDLSKTEIDYKNLTLADKWILQKNNSTIKEISVLMREYKLSQVADILKEYTWSDLADWYIEISKIEKKKDAILFHLLKDLLTMWHPFIPFVTEEIWSYIGSEKPLIISPWPKADDKFNFGVQIDTDIAKLQEVITSIRNIRGENKVEPVKKVDAVIKTEKYSDFLEKNIEIIRSLARVENINITKEEPANLEKTVKDVLEGVEVYVPLESMLDLDQEKERINKEIENYSKLIDGVTRKLSNREFVDKAPDSVVAKEKEKQRGYQEIIDNLNKNLNELQ